MISRFSAEIGTAIATAGLGLTAVVGSLEYGVGWGAAGPEPGTFPFYIGLLVTAASLVTLAQTVVGRAALQTVLVDRIQGMRVASFFGPMVLFVIASLLLGLCVATALYLTFVMWLQGGYRIAISAAAGLTAAIFFYFVLEVGFQVPLLKGPFEAALGLY
ncbi:tripartite tricarboxylate transporter TctB family protein [Microvirga brassicacearum]|uniref:Tripartite tricarboxylate transporter TctB family protein n=1 Tax=Microvirga brassicacearum TaxID=2580413 RepID=A0A5N3P751_9HYPH|nr:tripartite tricarboxylate transporter TctB family protein [Microvirga brassicacearum]KAB0265552.1 tripartite tricarboxylate transporter TctB family protein [Microvirga brassicacearum]